MVIRAVVLVLVLAAGAFAGCGGEDETVSPQAGATPEAEASPEPEAESEGDSSSSAEATVDVKGFDYRPKRVEVAAGGRVTWINRDRSNHTVTFADEGQPGVDNLRQAQRETVAFKEPGTFSYVCDYHPTMKGTVEVR